MVTPASALVVTPWPIDGVGAHPVAARPSRFARAGAAVGDAALLLTIAYSLPFVIILAGTPLALVITLLLWLGGVR